MHDELVGNGELRVTAILLYQAKKFTSATCAVTFYLRIMDGKRIGNCVVEIRDLERRILDLERQIDRIKTMRLSKVH